MSPIIDWAKYQTQKTFIENSSPSEKRPLQGEFARHAKSVPHTSLTAISQQFPPNKRKVYFSENEDSISAGFVLADGKLEGKVAVITGAASGIGRTTAVLFADEGACVLVADIDCGGGKETVHQIRARRREAVFVEADVTNENQVRHMINESVKEYGGVDVLFNSVGGGIPGGVPLSDLTEEQWDKVFSINLKSVFFCSRNAFPIMKKRGGGSIINVSSISVFTLRPDSGPYAVSKAGVICLTKMFAAEGAPYNIRVNCVVPSEIDTPLLRRDWIARYGSYKPVTSGSLAYRIGRTDEVARMVLFLASADSSWVSGADIEVSGAKHIPSSAKQEAHK